MIRPPVPLLVVAGLLAAGVLAGQAADGPRPVAAARTAGTVPVVGATAVCPDVRQQAGILTTRVSVGSTPTGPADVPAGPGRVVAGPLTAPTAVEPVPLPGPGQVAPEVGLRAADDGLVVEARGPLAAGLEVEQVTRGVRGADRGLSGGRCGPAGTEAWFLGGSTRAGSTAVLVLANPDDTQATVAVVGWSASGPLDSRLGQSLVVAPHARTVVPLDTLAPDRDLLALHLVSTRGRFAAALRAGRVSAGTPLGVDQVPSAPHPAREVVVPGIPAGPGPRRVLLANPGVDDAVAQLQLTTGDGQFVPAGLERVAVPAGRTVAVYITAAVAATPAAVRVTADQPLLAAAEVHDSQGTPVQDVAYAEAGGPLDGSALLTDLVLDRPTQSTLLLTALDGDASVVVTAVPVLGVPGPLPPPRTVEVPGGRTTALALSALVPPGASARLAVLITPGPGSSPVHVARYLRERGASGPLSTLLLLRGAVAQVPRPAVAPDLAAR
jgi:Family of unknown function (DUF5719)